MRLQEGPTQHCGHSLSSLTVFEKQAFHPSAANRIGGSTCTRHPQDVSCFPSTANQLRLHKTRRIPWAVSNSRFHSGTWDELSLTWQRLGLCWLWSCWSLLSTVDTERLHELHIERLQVVPIGRLRVLHKTTTQSHCRSRTAPCTPKRTAPHTPKLHVLQHHCSCLGSADSHCPWLGYAIVLVPRALQL